MAVEHEVGAMLGYVNALDAAKARIKLQNAAIRRGDCYLEYRTVYRPLLNRWYVVEVALSF